LAKDKHAFDISVDLTKDPQKFIATDTGTNKKLMKKKQEKQMEEMLPKSRMVKQEVQSNKYLKLWR